MNVIFLSFPFLHKPSSYFNRTRRWAFTFLRYDRIIFRYVREVQIIEWKLQWHLVVRRILFTTVWQNSSRFKKAISKNQNWYFLFSIQLVITVIPMESVQIKENLKACILPKIKDFLKTKLFCYDRPYISSFFVLK